FGNDGKYEDAYMIEKITDADGETIYEHESDTERVFSKETNYLTIDMMRDVLTEGTASYIPSKLKHGGVDWAGTTGTSQDVKATWFIRTNASGRVATWIGYDTPASVQCPGCSASEPQRNQEPWTRMVNGLSDV